MNLGMVLKLVIVTAICFSSVTFGKELPDGKNIVINVSKERGVMVLRHDSKVQGVCCTFKNGATCQANPCSQCNCAGNSIVIDMKELQ